MLLCGSEAGLLGECFFYCVFHGFADKLAQLGVLACTLHVQLARTVGNDNRLVCAGACSNTVGILTSLQQLLNSGSLGLGAGHQGARHYSFRHIAVQQKHNVYGTILHRLRLRLIVIRRVTCAPAVCFNAAGYDGRNCKLLKAHGFYHSVFHAGRRPHAAHLVRVQRQALGYKAHVLHIGVRQHFAGHACSLLGIIIIYGSVIIMVAAVIKRGA